MTSDPQVAGTTEVWDRAQSLAAEVGWTLDAYLTDDGRAVVRLTSPAEDDTHDQ